MIIYNPENSRILKERLIEAEKILNSIPAKSVFITGSFLFSEKYKDIDVFVITRRKKKIICDNPKVKITTLDFNKLHSLFYHSITKMCVSKNILPTKKLRVTTADYWSIINEAIPTMLNDKKKFQKDIRYLVLYTEYFLNNKILDSHELSSKINEFKNYESVLNYLSSSLPKSLVKKIHKGYINRYFYTQAGAYKGTLNYESHKYLYNLSHAVIKEASING